MEKKKYITKKRSFHTDKRTVNFSWLFMNIDGMIYSGNCIKGTILSGDPILDGLRRSEGILQL